MNINLDSDTFYFKTKGDDNFYSIEVLVPLSGKVDLNVVTMYAAKNFNDFNKNEKFPRDFFIYNSDKKFIGIAKVNCSFSISKIIEALEVPDNMEKNQSELLTIREFYK
jgi:hypothetical protein